MSANAAPDEAEIAAYLARTPGFFERHAELLAGIRLTSPHGQRAVTLSERQMEMLRERIKGLELKIVEMIRAGQENMALADRLHRFTRTLMRTWDPLALPAVAVATRWSTSTTAGTTSGPVTPTLPRPRPGSRSSRASTVSTGLRSA